jgi:hypothetical protein
LSVRVFTWPFALVIGRLPNKTLQGYQRDTFPVTANFNYFVPRSFCEGLIAQFEANAPKANASFSEARSRLKQKADEHPDDPWSLSYLGLADAFLGQKADAIAEGRHAVEILPVSKDALNGAFFPPNLELKLSPTWDPLRSHRRFEKLLEEAHPK